MLEHVLKTKHTSSHLYSAKHWNMCWVWLASKGLMHMLKCLLIQRLTVWPSKGWIPCSDTLSSLPTSPSPAAGFMPCTTRDLLIYKLSHFHWANILHVSENCSEYRIKTTSPEQSVIHLIYIAVSLHNVTEGKKKTYLKGPELLCKERQCLHFNYNELFLHHTDDP